MRGQTTLDFAIGVSIFLLSVAFVLTFVPGMVQPFTANPQEEMSVADRVATQLVQEMLAGTDPYVLDTDCTVEFFRTDATGGVACPFAENDLSSGGTLPGRLGISTDQEIQVRLQGDLDGDGTSNLLCWDATNKLLVEQGGGTCDVPFSLQTESPPTSAGSTSSAVRIASLRSYDTTVEVQTW